MLIAPQLKKMYASLYDSFILTKSTTATESFCNYHKIKHVNNMEKAYKLTK